MNIIAWNTVRDAKLSDHSLLTVELSDVRADRGTGL